MSLTVVIPAARFSAAQGVDPTLDLDLPGLRALLGRADLAETAGSSPEALLRGWFGAEAVGAAQLGLRLDWPDAPPGFWLRADPVHLRADRDAVLLLGHGGLGIDPSEAEALTGALNRLFGADGLHFYAPHPDRWYLRLDQDPGLTTTAPVEVLGSDIHPHLPRGEAALRWHALINEMQMLLYTHSVNDARELAGKPAVNSLWLWGEGPAPADLRRPFARVCGDDATLAALAVAADVPQRPLPPTLDGEVSGSDTLLWLDALSGPGRLGDLMAWREALQALDHVWLQTLLAAWKSGAIPHLRLVFPDSGGNLTAELKPATRWKFWRGAAPVRRLALA
ncbi:hypothetical protein [Chitinimonas lacunae]|uniref:Phosphoglycerate mutase n=1 Tax=Chitinimonas lacunae TaxID=1963018 RepID=A0ABV8MLI0_9NEIS